MAILHRRPYERIRVSDITRKAAVGRATFYAHFASKDELLRREFRRVVLHMVYELPHDPCPVDATRLFAHVLDARELYRSLVGGGARDLTERIVREELEARIRSSWAKRGGTALEPREFAPCFVASTLLALLSWALERNPAPFPGALQDTFRSLVGRALARGS